MADKKKFSRFLKRNAGGVLPTPLPMVHSSRCEFIDTLIAQPTLEPRQCPVLRKNLLYFFYGRPSYRPRSAGVHDIEYCPICFVFRLPNSQSSLEKVFPFDSGAAADGRYEPHIDRSELSAFELKPTLESARRTVQVVYGNNRDYFLGHPVAASNFSFQPGEAAERYFDLLTDPRIQNSDERRSSIEAISSDPTDLRKNVLAVVLPERFLDKMARPIIEDWGALPITYPVWEATCPAEYSRVIQQKLLEFFERHAIIRKESV